ncbi:MAG: KpsF/GutQ family sugar-phosphate isomerase [Sandaracinus sp.]|nr:KpsF/GutQ family sugar-phosphate isomerase [Sandaracinus sp.]MCB9631606.1 KpsF/GutQ family sugar-phosphate isomerase [Sandaracinus sp.]
MAFDASARAHDNVSVLDPFANEARECFKQQAAAISALAGRIDRRFGQAVRALHAVSGHVIITGLGKSGHIGRKLAATFASTGTPSFFVHSSEAFHGDLGMITSHDAVILISYSGETPEVAGMLPHLKARGVPTIALVGKVDSTLGRGADMTLDVSVEREVDPNGLAPTSSTLAALAMGDALAVALVRMRGFRAEDFARLHPSGPLGRKGSRMREVAETDVVAVGPETTVRDALFALATSPLPVAAVVSHGVLVGSIGEVELRDALNRGGLDEPVGRSMCCDPLAVSADAVVTEVEDTLEKVRASYAFIVDERGGVLGVFRLS